MRAPRIRNEESIFVPSATALIHRLVGTIDESALIEYVMADGVTSDETNEFIASLRSCETFPRLEYEILDQCMILGTVKTLEFQSSSPERSPQGLALNALMSALTVGCGCDSWSSQLAHLVWCAIQLGPGVILRTGGFIEWLRGRNEKPFIEANYRLGLAALLVALANETAAAGAEACKRDLRAIESLEELDFEAVSDDMTDPVWRHVLAELRVNDANVDYLLSFLSDPIAAAEEEKGRSPRPT